MVLAELTSAVGVVRNLLKMLFAWLRQFMLRVVTSGVTIFKFCGRDRFSILIDIRSIFTAGRFFL